VVRNHVIFLCLCLTLFVVSGCTSGNQPSSPTGPTNPQSACTPASPSEFAYSLPDGTAAYGYSVSMYSVNSCTGAFTPTSPASVATGYSYPQQGAEEMAVDPLGRFLYVANLVSNVSDLSTISMYTIDSATGVLTPTTPATVPTGWCPQEIAIDPQGRFVYTANSNDSSVSMFTVDQTSGVLTPTSPATVSTLVPNELLSDPSFLTVDPSGKFLYVTASLSDGAAIFMYTIDQTTGLLTPTSPATVYTGGIPFQVRVSPNGKFAYVVDNLATSQETFGVWQYTVDSTTGVLTPNNPAAVASGDAPTEVAVDPTSSFAYVVNRLDNTLSMYTIDQTTGNLTPNGTMATGSEPFRAEFDPSGKYLYVVNEGGPDSVFTVNSDGTLKVVDAGGTGTSSVSIGFTASK
jgi:6-phosphogluconolactonase